MKYKDFDLEVSFIKDNNNYYEFYLDYGTNSSAIFNVSENNEVYVDLGNITYPDWDLIEKKRKDDLLKYFFKEIFGNSAEKIIDLALVSNVKDAFLNTQKFIEKNNIKVSYKEYDDFSKTDNYYELVTFYDEEMKIVNFYIKNETLDDEVGLKVYWDGTYYPIISTKHLKISNDDRKKREKLIKDFVYQVLKVNIKFEYKDGYTSLRIPELINRAISYAKKNGTVTYNDDKDDIYEYKNGKVDFGV